MLRVRQWIVTALTACGRVKDSVSLLPGTPLPWACARLLANRNPSSHAVVPPMGPESIIEQCEFVFAAAGGDAPVDPNLAALMTGSRKTKRVSVIHDQPLNFLESIAPEKDKSRSGPRFCFVLFCFVLF